MKLNPRLLREARQSGLAIIISISLGLVGGILGILQARQVSRTINQVFLEHKTLDAVINVIAIVLVLIVLRVGFSYAGEVCASIAARRIKQDLRHRLFSHIMSIGPAYLKNEAGAAHARTGELVTTATEGIDALEVYFSQYLPQIALAALIPLAILIFVFPIDLLSAVIFLVTAPLLPLFMYLIGTTAEALTRRQWQGLGRMSAYFLDILQGLTTLKSFGRSREQIAVIGEVSEKYRQTTMSVLRVTFLSALVLELIATLSTAVVAVEIGLRLLYGKLLFEQAFFLLLLAPEFYQPLRLLGTRFHAGMAGVEAARRIFEILDLPAEQAIQNPAPPFMEIKSPPSISFRDVSYTYSNGQSAVQDITFDVPPGKLTALAGVSGSGKTTLTWLLLGFLQPKTGQVLVDGMPLSSIHYARWLENLAWVPQNPYLFNDTLMANITLAKPGASQAEIAEASRLAHMDDFISDLPIGYQTQIGERGVRLSAGQAQRVSLARAFLKDAPLLILDEATSHLDPEADQLIRLSMQQLSAGRTVLVIAHHQNTLAMADQVVTLSGGKLAHIESHTQPHPANPLTLLSYLSQPGSHNNARSSTIGNQGPNRLAMRSNSEPVERRLLKLISPFLGRIAISVMLGFATVASGVGLMATAAYIISAAALHPSIADLQVAIVGVRFFGLSRGIFRYLERLVSHDTTLRLLASWRTWFYQALEPLAPARLAGYHSGDLLARVISDINSLENFYVRSFAPPLVALLVAIATTWFLGSFGAPLAWGLLVLLALAGIGLPWLSLAQSHHLGPAIIRGRSHLSALLVDGIQGMADLLTSGQAPAYIERVRQAGEQLSRLQRRWSVQTATLTAISNLLANLGMMVVLVLGIQRVSHGQLEGVFLGVVTLAALTCFEALLPLPVAAQYYDANRAAASRLYELVDAKPEVIDSTSPLPLPADSRLVVKDLAFEYPAQVDESSSADTPPFRLQDISFSLPQGKHTALVGPSGAGKTTLINLLLRFWEYQQGSILLGNQELRQYSSQELRRHMAVISQNTYLFSASIKENLLIAQPRASNEEIKKAASQAQIHDFILSLPEGYNTWIGEHGLRLSAGERQRLAVARALLMRAPLLILDEPAANLDPAMEQSLLAAIREASHGVSSITITQSMAGLESMDEILVLRDGRIIERGSHDQLLAQQGSYWQMWKLAHETV